MISIISILLERNEFDDYRDILKQIDTDIEYLDNKKKQEYINVRNSIYRKYLSVEEYKKFIEISDKIFDTSNPPVSIEEYKFDFDIREKIGKLLTKEESEKLSKYSKSYLKIIHTLGKYKLNKKAAYKSAFKDIDHIKGDLNAKYLYHFTTIDNAISIIKDNALYAYGDNPWISFTTYKDLLKRGVVFYYTSPEGIEGRSSDNISIGFVFDFNKIKSAFGSKVKQGDADRYGTYYGEEEILIKEEEIELKKYLIKIIIYKSKIRNKKDLDKLTMLCDEEKIKYFLV